MSDTQRSLAELDSLLPLNTDQEISPQDLRDAILESLKPSMGGNYIDVANTQETVISSTGVYTKVLGTTIQTIGQRFSQSANNRIVYNGRSDIHVHFASTISFTAASDNQLIAFKLALNGVVEDGSYVPRKVGTGSDVGSVAMHWDFSMTAGDYWELFVANLTSTANISVTSGYTFGVGFIK